MARAQGVRGLTVDAERVGMSAATELSAVLAVLFAQEAAIAMASGPLRGYRSEDQTLAVLRGRVRLRDQYLRRFGVPTPLDVTVGEWTLDTDDNRRLRAANAALLALPDLPPATRKRLLRLDRLLSDARLHRLLHLADVALAHLSVEHEAGGTQTRTTASPTPQRSRGRRWPTAPAPRRRTSWPSASSVASRSMTPGTSTPRRAASIAASPTVPARTSRVTCGSSRPRRSS